LGLDCHRRDLRISRRCDRLCHPRLEFDRQRRDSDNGLVVLFIGVIATLAVGGGLMALIFYSSRKQYDAEAHGIQEQYTPREPE
jgi:hypothetical protein